MQKRSRSWITMVMAAGMFAGVAAGQDKTLARTSAGLKAYDVTREASLIGTVLAYTAGAQTAPLGAHLTLQTGAGIVDVHLGDARLLAANHFTIQSGDTLRIIGENVACGKGVQFVARIAQKGTQVLAVRSVRGIPLSYMAPHHGTKANSQGGAL